MLDDLLALTAVRETVENAAGRPGRPSRGLLPASAWDVGLPGLGGAAIPGTLAG